MQIQIESVQESPNEDSDEIAKARGPCLHIIKHHKSYMWDAVLSDTLRQTFHVLPEPPKSAKIGRRTLTHTVFPTRKQALVDMIAGC